MYVKVSHWILIYTSLMVNNVEHPFMYFICHPYLLTKVHLIKAIVFPVVVYGCETWTIRELSAGELMLLNCGVV